MPLVVCVDVGSTFTKAAAIDVESAALIAIAAVPTTAQTDVLFGLDAAVAAVTSGRQPDQIRVCSSAGGGLRLAVVGFERAITAEAENRVGLSAGARVVHVAAGELTSGDVAAMLADRPDIVLLCGGTDGGDETVVANARLLAGLRIPVVVACNAAVAQDVGVVLHEGGVAVTVTDNVLPRIGVLDPAPARTAIREAFISHVIGGKGLSKGDRFRNLVSHATPDAVLTGVELFATGASGVAGIGDVVVVDVGGATTDVYSVVQPDEDSLQVAAVAELLSRRTVEGDLGMRHNALGIVAAAIAESLPVSAAIEAAARIRAADPMFLPDSPGEQDLELELAHLAVTVAMRRHARPYDVPGGGRAPGRDLRKVVAAVGSGGVLRHADQVGALEVLAPVTNDVAGGWELADRAALSVDVDYVLAPAGLLAADRPDVAAELLRQRLPMARR